MRQEVAIFQPCIVVFTHFFVFFPEFLNKVCLSFSEKRRHNCDRSRRVKNVNHRMIVSGVVWRDFDSGVHLGSSGSSNQKRLFEASLGQLFRDHNHLVKRWSNESRETDDVNIILFRFLQDQFTRAHDTNVVDFEVVATENNCNDILANIMNVALYCGHQDFAGVVRIIILIEVIWVQTHLNHVVLLFFVHKRQEIGNCFLHHAGRLNNLWQKHFPRAKEVTHYVHPIHEWTFNDF
mmetsp:Transcript_910/g.1843  ORF Transcript_910/g.1843 Transcript_910/m.1843 type:complete len:236 (+) Transcript_910:1029-1736(+)